MAVSGVNGGAIPLGPNAIINGAFDIWQRGTSFSFGALIYGADRFQCRRGSNAAGGTLSRQTSGLTGILYSARVQRNSGNTGTQNLTLGTALELSDVIPLAGKTVTLSFYAKAGANYSATSSLLNYNFRSSETPNLNWLAVDGATPTDIVPAGSFTLTTSWQRFTLTGVVPSNAQSLSMYVFELPTGTAGADDWFEITGIQLEAGLVATPFKRNANSLQGELAACQRYFYRLCAANEPSSGTTSPVAIGQAYATTNAIYPIRLPVEMRVVPGLVPSAAGHFTTSTANYGDAILTAVSLSGQSTRKSLRLDATVSSGLVAGHATILQTNNGAATLDLAAEL